MGARSNLIICQEIAASGKVPELDFDRELAVQKACLEAAEAGLLLSAHDCSDGGLAVALAESCFSSLGREATGAAPRRSAGPSAAGAAPSSHVLPN